MKYLHLAKQYNLVVGDRFELFYRGVIRLHNPYQYYILVTCPKGNPFPRYFTYTPKASEEGCYELKIQLFDNDHNIIDEASTNLIVENPSKPSKKLNILCIGDSITVNGVWPKVGYERVCLNEENPQGLNYGDVLNFMGTCKTSVDDKEIGYEGYGGWTWKSYCTNDHIGLNSSVWIKTKHHLTEADQHSQWESDGLSWILETIEENRLKFKRGPKNISMLPNLGKTLQHVANAIHQDTLFIDSFEYEKTNPFWDKENNTISFKNYISLNKFENPDLIYILLTWNGLYIPYNHDFSHHFDYARMMLRKIHEEYPLTKVRLLGIHICSINGGIASNYGATGPYHDTFGEVSTAFYYNEALEQLCDEEEFSSFTEYVDTKAQFDSEYNMPSTLMKVNARSNITESIGTNGVHPNMDGYMQIGDVFYRKLISDINRINKKG